MDRVLLASAAALAALSLSAQAQARNLVGSGIPQAKPSISGEPATSGFCRGGGRHHGGGRCGRGDVVLDSYGGEWALYNNRSWESDSFNDWWHDRPDRAFPRWVQEQHGGPCTEDRMWWSGSGWHC